MKLTVTFEQSPTEVPFQPEGTAAKTLMCLLCSGAARRPCARDGYTRKGVAGGAPVPEGLPGLCQDEQEAPGKI